MSSKVASLTAFLKKSKKNTFVCVRIASPKVSSKTITSAPRAFLLLEQLTEPIALKQAGKVGCALQYLG